MRRQSRIAGLTAAAIVAVVTMLYLVLIDPEPGERARIAVVGASLATAAVFAAVGSWTGRASLLASAVGLLMVWGCLGIFSIGAPLLLAAVLTFVAFEDTADSAAERTRGGLIGAASGIASAAIALGLT